ncbi:transcriptional regulator NanR [Cupriavidus basilensis]|uniref:transcriptional regulator NanR n=1 Tax=Cupriavidus basilensis TaxID=68895 RepID=UPI000750D7A3|nr:transcriptional regulator NanR [Cupriavidus basilensis]
MQSSIPNQPIRRKKLYEEVASRLESMMLSGVLRPGDTLPPERELMDTFEVGRSSIREALFALQKMGLVVIRNGERAYVTRPSADALVGELSGAVRHLLSTAEGVRDFQQARTMHEISLVRYAAQHASADDIAALGQALEANRHALGNAAEFTRTDVEFHLAIARIPNNPIFLALHTAMARWLEEQRATSLQSAGAEQAAFRAHERIHAAIAAHQPDAAETAMLEHLREVESHYWAAKTA